MQILRIVTRQPKTFCAGLIACLFILTGSRLLAEDEERAKWISDHWKVVEHAKMARNEISIKELGDIVGPLGENLFQLKPDFRELYDEACKTLISIPGHADYFGNRIKAMTDGDVSGNGTNLSGRREWDFQVLAHLQSPDTVRVLGECLFDERNPFKGTSLDSPWVPTSMNAEVALFDLGLSNPPVSGPIPDYENDLHTWQLWYQQVRAGTRTFSFKGDDRVYTLAGPVNEAKDPESSTSTRPSSSIVSQSTAEPPKRSKWPLAVTFVAAAAALFVLLRKAKRQSSSQ